MKPWLVTTVFVSFTSLVVLMGTIEGKARLISQSTTPTITPVPTPTITPRPTIEEFMVSGTEPFWGVTIARRGIVLTTPDAKPKTFPYVAPIAAQGRPIDVVRVYRLAGRPNQMLVIRKGTCSDGMSDRQYPYSATLILGNTVREGCAAKK
jgi:uncharacterized membrane protein